MPANSKRNDASCARWISGLPIVFVLVFFLLWALACSKSPDASKSSEPQPNPIRGSDSPPMLPVIAKGTPTSAEMKQNPPPPKTEEVLEAMARVFDKAASLDESHAPSFVVGDFNGDGWEDVAVVAKAGDGSLTEINSELANWTLEDPRAVTDASKEGAGQMLRPRAVKAEKTDSLLAIIHGIGPQGWRNREARQTFLLRNGVGKNIVVRSSNNLPRLAGNPRLPPFRGDAISETLNGRGGIIFWTGAKYAWYLTSN
jgi:hypothetical protein